MIYEDLSDPDPENVEPIEEGALISDVEYFESTDAYDQCISSLVMLPKYEGFSRALVTRRKQDSYRNIMVSRHYNPLLDTSIYND